MPPDAIQFEFVELMPTDFRDDTLYVSLRYRTTAHLCLCGCGEKIVNPLRPHRWRLIFDGATISLDPSIGNSGIPCKSHYWILRSKVRWLPSMTDAQTARALRKDGWSGDAGATTDGDALSPGSEQQSADSWFVRLHAWLRRLRRRQ